MQNHNATAHTGSHNIIQYRSYINFDNHLFLEYLFTTPWNIIEMFDSPNDALDCWKYLLFHVVDRHAPMMERRIKRSKQSEWFSADIKKAIYLRDKFTGTSNIESAKYWHNKVTDVVHKAKCSYYKEFIYASLCDGKICGY